MLSNLNTYMTKCPYLVEDAQICKIASDLATRPAKTNGSACKSCSTDFSPSRDINQVTVSLAAGACWGIDDSHGRFIIEKYRDLFPSNNDNRLKGIINGSGVGSQLWKLLEGLGIEHKPSCPCLEWAERMNLWGPVGCRLSRKEIIGHMKSSSKNYGWGDLTKAVVKAIATGLALRLSVTDPYGSLLDEAIRRAENV